MGDRAGRSPRAYEFSDPAPAARGPSFSCERRPATQRGACHPAKQTAKEAEAAPLLSAEEEMAREMEAARREAEAMMASFQAAHEESKEAPAADVEAPPQPSATGPRRLAPAFEQHASPARGGQHHSSSRGGQHASSLRSGARRKKKGPARRAPGH